MAKCTGQVSADGGKNQRHYGTIEPMNGTPIHLWIGLFAQNSQSLTLSISTASWPTTCIIRSLPEDETMALSKNELIQELKHEIYSPLTAIRNALYLAAIRK
jgi:hypothetical protein